MMPAFGSPAPGPRAGSADVETPPAGLLPAIPEETAAPASPDDAVPGALPPSRVEWAAVPRINLLPPEIMDARRFRRLQHGLAGGVLAVAVLCGLATVWAQHGVSSAGAALEITRNEAESLRTQQTRYAEVPTVNAELEAARAARERALGSDVLWYRFLTDLAVNTPGGTVLSTVSITLTGGTAAPAAAPELLTPAGLGTVTVQGEAGRFVDVAAWLDAAGRVNGLDGTRLTSAARASNATGAAGSQDSKISYSGTAVITGAALSHRYDRKAS